MLRHRRRCPYLSEQRRHPSADTIVDKALSELLDTDEDEAEYDISDIENENLSEALAQILKPSWWA